MNGAPEVNQAVLIRPGNGNFYSNIPVNFQFGAGLLTPEPVLFPACSKPCTALPRHLLPRDWELPIAWAPNGLSGQAPACTIRRTWLTISLTPDAI